MIAVVRVVGAAVSLGSVRAQFVCRDRFVLHVGSSDIVHQEVDYLLLPITYSVH